MLLKGIIWEDFTNYKKPSTTLIFPYCSFKCDKECGYAVCQNGSLAALPAKNINIITLIDTYLKNPITHSIVMQGLEPFDSWEEVYAFIFVLRKIYNNEDDIVIYTGYNKQEITQYINRLAKFKNIIVKFGRYIPNSPSRFDNLLEVNLASDNQYAELISTI